MTGRRDTFNLRAGSDIERPGRRYRERIEGARAPARVFLDQWESEDRADSPEWGDLADPTVAVVEKVDGPGSRDRQVRRRAFAEVQIGVQRPPTVAGEPETPSPCKDRDVTVGFQAKDLIA